MAAGLAAGYAVFRMPPTQSIRPEIVAEQTVDRIPAVAPQALELETGVDVKTQQLLSAALRKGPQIERENELYGVIESLSADDLKRIVGDADKLFHTLKKVADDGDANTVPLLMSGLIGRWLEQDRGEVVAWLPRALDAFLPQKMGYAWMLDVLGTRMPVELLDVVALRKDPKEKVGIIKIAFRELAASDSNRAQAWLANCKDATERRWAEGAYWKGIVQSDPLRAVELMESMENRSDAVDLMAFAASRAAKRGSGYLRQLADLPMKPWMMAGLVGEFAERDPALSVEFALKARSEMKDGVPLATAFAALAKHDRALCLEKLEELKGADLATAVSTVGSTWFVQDPAAALSWLMQRPSSERTFANNDTLLTCFADWMKGAPAQARAWTDALPPGEVRNQLQGEIAEALAKRGQPEEAIKVIGQLGKAADTKMIIGVVGAWAVHDPQAAANWAIANQSGPAQSLAVATVVRKWAADDVPAVERWLSEFPPGDVRDQSVSHFLWRMSAWSMTQDQRNDEFNRWFDFIDDPGKRAQVARSSFYNRKSRDPESARAWLSSLKNVDPEIIRATLRDDAN